MGQVYRAEDTKLGRYVALKLLAPEATRDQTAKRRLLANARVQWSKRAVSPSVSCQP